MAVGGIMNLTYLLTDYEKSHQHPVNKRCHAIGIPLIVLSIPTLAFSWRVAIGLFVVGWIFQFIGHRYEGKQPAFFSNLVFLLVGPIWLAKDIWRRLMGPT